ncbi:hypothetical protein ACFWFX_15430 [Streptomyces roseolus]|uniref:hypothetical protein n=1 Tax=Streptomyces roseolus TaxID=67358 RepID=UPI0036626F39
MKAYKILGTTDDVTTCELCGRDELKGTVALCPLDVEGNEDGLPVYFGTSCAAKAAGWTVREVKAGVKKAESAKREAEREARIKAREDENRAYKVWVADTYGDGIKDAVQQYGAAGLWAKFKASREVPATPVTTEPITVDVPTCNPSAGDGSVHLMTVRCVECNAFRMSKMNVDKVGTLYRSGYLGQDEFEAYMHAWATSAVRYSADGWETAPTDPNVVRIVAAIRRHAGIPTPVDLAA